MCEKRIDLMLTELGFARSREKAKRMIEEGGVWVNGLVCKKPSLLCQPDCRIEIKGPVLPYVSRGGYKLEQAISEFSLNLAGKTAIDIGASTGGFTDCMLQNGVKKVFAVDVGHGQLDEKLQTDSRVVNLEGLNVRNLTLKEVGEKADFITADTSFISLTYVLPVIFGLLKENGQAVVLVKPQFEAGREHLNKKGVVKSPKVHGQVLEQLYHFISEKNYSVLNACYSPIRGPEGNIEYLLLIAKKSEKELKRSALGKVVEEAHRTL